MLDWLAAIVMARQPIRIGRLVTPDRLAVKLARETVSLHHLSDGLTVAHVVCQSMVDEVAVHLEHALTERNGEVVSG